MTDLSTLGSYKWISICEKLIIVTTIILAIVFFVAGIVLSIVLYDVHWMFVPVFIGGTLICLANYFFGMLLLSLFHNIYTIKRNMEKCEKQRMTNSPNMSTNRNYNVQEAGKKPNKNKKNQSKLPPIPKPTNTYPSSYGQTCPSCNTINSLTATHCKECGCPLK